MLNSVVCTIAPVQVSAPAPGIGPDNSLPNLVFVTGRRDPSRPASHSPLASFGGESVSADPDRICTPRISSTHDLARIHDVGGSSARLIARIASSAGAPCSASRYFILPCPTPCSPVQVPSIASARSISRSLNALATLTSSGSSHVDQQRQMEIAVADMADDRRDQLALGDVALGLGDAFGQPRERHADVGRDHAGAGPQREGRRTPRCGAPPRAWCAPPAAWSIRTARRRVPRRSRRSAPTARRRSPRCRGTPGTASASRAA